MWTNNISGPSLNSPPAQMLPQSTPSAEHAEEITSYQVTRVSSLVLGEVHFETSDDALYIIKASFVVLPLSMLGIVICSFVAYPLSSPSTVSATVYMFVELLSNYRTIVSYLLFLWFLAYQGLNLLVRRHVEMDEVVRGEVCWKAIKRCVSEWQALLVLMPDGQIRQQQLANSQTIWNPLISSGPTGNDANGNKWGHRSDDELYQSTAHHMDCPIAGKSGRHLDADKDAEQLQTLLRALEITEIEPRSSIGPSTVILDTDEIEPVLPATLQRSGTTDSSLCSSSPFLPAVSTIRIHDDNTGNASHTSEPIVTHEHRRPRNKTSTSTKTLSSIASSAVSHIPRFLRNAHHRRHESHEHATLSDGEADHSSHQLHGVVVHRMARSVSAHSGLLPAHSRRTSRSWIHGNSNGMNNGERLRRTRTVSTTITAEEWQETYGGTYMLIVRDWEGFPTTEI